MGEDKYRCLNPECNWKWREQQCGRRFIPEGLTIKFINLEGRLIRKCPYCRGKVEKVEGDQ